MSTEIAEVARPGTGISVQNVLKNLDMIQELMRDAMDKGIDYGVIPGTERKDKDGKDISKPTLLKPGAEKLGFLFKLAPRFKTVKTYSPDGHLLVDTTCELFDINDNYKGEANRTCSTRESKYRWRQENRKCPDCGKEAIIKGKKEYGGGWICFKKKDGCGAKFPDNDPQIVEQQVGRIENPDLADSYNTVIAIAEKRAYVAAMRIVTSSSALFDEEIPGVSERDAEPPHEEPRRDPPKPQRDPDNIAGEEWAKEELAKDPPLAHINDVLMPFIKANPSQQWRMGAWSHVEPVMEGKNYVMETNLGKATGKWIHKAEAEHGPIPF